MTAKRMEEGKIVVPWDFSNLSVAALNSVLKIAGDSSQIRVIHVASPLTGPDNGALYDSAVKHKTLTLKKRFHEQIGKDERFRHLSFYVNYGHVAQEIVRFAESYRASLILMTSRDRRGLSRILFGGLPERVVRSAKCPVLVLQAENCGHTIENARWQSFVSEPKPHQEPPFQNVMECRKS